MLLPDCILPTRRMSYHMSYILYRLVNIAKSLEFFWDLQFEHRWTSLSNTIKSSSGVKSAKQEPWLRFLSVVARFSCTIVLQIIHIGRLPTRWSFSSRNTSPVGAIGTLQQRTGMP